MTDVHLSTLPAAADASTPMDLVPESGPTPDDSPDEEPCKDVTVQTDLTMADLQALQVENEKLTCNLHREAKAAFEHCITSPGHRQP
ncbi:hypothetical protein MTO96_051403 [Rhipicephalus appendiculatus]